MISQKIPIENYQKVLKDAELLYTDTEINKTIDDVVEINSPKGQRSYTIKSIKYV